MRKCLGQGEHQDQDHGQDLIVPSTLVVYNVEICEPKLSIFFARSEEKTTQDIYEEVPQAQGASLKIMVIGQHTTDRATNLCCPQYGNWTPGLDSPHVVDDIQ